MSIEDRRIKQAINRIIEDNLKKGYMPTSKEVISEIDQYVSTNELSKPEFNYRKFYSDFDIEEIDRASEHIYNDIHIIYESLSELYREIQKQINKFESEKKKYTYRFNKIESEVLNLTNKYSSSTYVDSLVEDFNDLGNINLQETDANIDINNKEATLGRMNNKIFKQIKDISINYYEHDEVRADGLLEDVIDRKGQYWKATLETSIQKRTYVEIILDLGEVISLNKIEIESPMVKATDMVIGTSKDSDEWSESSVKSILSKHSDNIGEKCRYIKLTLSKEEADKYLDNKYQYIYIIDTIKLYYTSYKNKSTIITKPLKMKTDINKVSLIEDATIPSGSDIRYYVALNKSPVEWVEITPINRKNPTNNKVVSFNTTTNIEGKNLFINNSISKDEYEIKELRVNNQKIYNITPGGLTANKIIKNKVYKGANSWKEEKIKTYTEEDITNQIFLDNKNSISTSYKKINPYRNGQILNGEVFTQPTVIKYSTTIEKENGKEVVKGNLVSNFQVSLYLNGELLYIGVPDNGKNINYMLNNGTNLIEVMINIPNANEIDEAVAYLDLGLNISSLSKYIHADDKSMKEVSLFNLRYNTNNRKDVYSIVERNSGYSLLAKEDDMDIDYVISYEYLIEEVDELLFSAVMTKNYNTIKTTPILRGVEIRIL